MNRVDRLSAILIHLQSRRVVKAQDIADRFDISLRTVYRDMKALEEGGIPLIGEAGQGYSLADGYRLPPVMFTRDEAVAFITAEKLVSQLTDEVNSSSYQSALYKVKSVLKTAEKDHLQALENGIEVLKSRPNQQMQTSLNPLQLLLTAVAEKKVIDLNYFSYYRQQHTRRHVEPVGVFYLDNYWHLIAWCRSSKDYRDFRFDRMQEIQTLADVFEDRHPSLKTYLDGIYQSRNLQRVVIRVSKEAALHLGEQKYYHGFIGEVECGEQLEITFLTAYLNGFARWYLMFGDYGQIIEPPELNEQVKTMAEKILSKL